jgi:thioredoxin-related protein
MMRVYVRRTTVVAAFLAALLLPSASFGQTQPNQDDKGTLDPVDSRKDLYPPDVDAKKEIDEALKQAAVDKKRVLLVFGGNWCYDCHVLDRALHEGAAGKVVKESFLIVHVDIGEGEKNPDLVKQYKTTLDKGVPVVVILSAEGSWLYGSGDGEFEAARKMMKKDLVAFLLRWRGSKPTAGEKQ